MLNICGPKKMNKKIEILAIDIGNTSVLFAHFSGNSILRSHRIPTASLNARTIATIKKKFTLRTVQAAVVASVVPRASQMIQKFVPEQLHLRTFIIGKHFEAPIVNRYKNPKQVGIDRLVNAAAAFHRYRRDAIVIDFGTAITLDIVSKKGEYLGGVIAPGIEISLEALHKKTALLPKIRLVHPSRLIGRDTTESIRVGCSVGIGGLCDRLCERIVARFHFDPIIIATGGYARFMKRYCEKIDEIVPNLTMEGILLSYKKFLTK